MREGCGLVSLLMPDMRSVACTALCMSRFVLTGGCVYYFAAPQHPTPRCIIPLDSVTVREHASLSNTPSRTEQVSCGCQVACDTAVHGGVAC